MSWLFTATVAAYRDKPGRKSSVSVKSGHRESPGRREWLVIMVDWSWEQPLRHDPERRGG
jgi:hypothetical protein